MAATIAAVLIRRSTSSPYRRLLLPIFSHLQRPAPQPTSPWIPPHHRHRLFSSDAPADPDRNLPPLDPKQLWHELSTAEPAAGSSRLPKATWDDVVALTRDFAKNPTMADQALALYIPASAFPTYARHFRHFLPPRLSQESADRLLSLPAEDAHALLLQAFTEYCVTNHADELRQNKSVMAAADLTAPHTWYPFARAMRRRVVYHCGPTNSGKTHNALARFSAARSGVYCSPLRLLAMEVFDKVNALGVYCTLRTGQEVKEVPFANHVTCTIEMLSTEDLYEVAVVDEIQMMADPTRGYAWTRAVLGLKADEIHLCGDPSVLKIVRKVCADTGDDLEVHQYERFKPLVVEAKSLLGDLKNVRAGDCIVAFSRREIFEVKLAIEKFTKHKCCVIYGALPPETRRQQAKLFNEQDNEYDVLVASDAVGMGLNLNIRRVVFYSLSKYNGDRMVPVAASQVKQIAGRAGRRGSVYPDGLTTTFLLDDLEYLIECLQQPFEEAKKIGLFPCFEQVEMFASQFPDLTFTELLDKFSDNCRIDNTYFMCQQDSIKKVANMLERVQGLSLKDRYSFCFAPVNIRDPKAMYHLLRFATHYSKSRRVSIAMGMPRGSATNDTELLDLETKHQVLSMYLWLSHHFEEDNFPHAQKAEEMAVNIADLLGKSLAKASWKPESRQQTRQRREENEESDSNVENMSDDDAKSVSKVGYERPRSLPKKNSRSEET
ncbi:ATP-dependent RNA helicase SUV3L, mitochondrial isoform X2 [Lolium perenne]|uniref:ATP-dependent RNA helicase SUV3L, mitochondrial isoform X2 n=1 Tax=Lolium perenne TaxID=4522 RepID=UPI0021F51778|nr:ATP-dependent RNA helicase SUV3L, mitochondrial isoform X2 [Lolium perenne]